MLVHCIACTALKVLIFHPSLSVHLVIVLSQTAHNAARRTVLPARLHLRQLLKCVCLCNSLYIRFCDCILVLYCGFPSPGHWEEYIRTRGSRFFVVGAQWTLTMTTFFEPMGPCALAIGHVTRSAEAIPRTYSRRETEYSRQVNGIQHR